jgi:hypothetical protein
VRAAEMPFVLVRVKFMKRNLRQAVWVIIFASCFGSSELAVAKAQHATSTSPEVKHSDVSYRVQIHFLVASNSANAKTDYPASLEAVVKQLKPSLQFKNHYLVATYLYNVADGSSFEVSDVTYQPFEQGGGISPTFFNLGITRIKSNTNSDSIHISRLRVETRKRMFMQNAQGEGSTAKPVFETVGTGITTELNVKAGVPAIVGTTASGISDGVLVLIITVNSSGM